MAKDKPVAITCCVCGKVVPPSACGIPVDYVWFNGKNICKECVAKGAVNPKNGH